MTNFWTFLNSKGYIQGVFWIILVSLVSNLNDIFMRLVGNNLHYLEVSFFRFFFGALTLSPVLLYKGKSYLYTKRPFLHSLRAFLAFIAIICWVYGVTQVPLITVTIIGFTVPIFVLPLSIIFLREKPGFKRTAATIIGFIGILVVVFSEEKQAFTTISSTVNIGLLILISGAVLFAISDILNKKMVVTEGFYTLLFYFALGTTLLSLIPFYFYPIWKTPTAYELSCLFFLGLGGNLILYCLLKAFAATEVSALAPYRYVELLFSAFFGFLLFYEIPKIGTLMGAAIIIPCTLSIAYIELENRKKNKI